MDRSPVRGAARLAAILDSLPEALLLADASGRVVNANAVALGWFEGGGSPLVGRSVSEFLSGYGTALARITDPNAGVWSDPGVPDDGRGQRAAGDPERMAASRADGGVFPAEIMRSSLPAVHGSLELIVVRDVTGVADAEQELRRQQRQTELILRAASEGIVGVDTAGRIVLVNPAAARILGYRASELGGREFHSLSSTGSAVRNGNGLDNDSPVLDTLRTGRKHRLGAESAVYLHAKDGTAVPVELSTAPVMENEVLVGAVVTFVDLSKYWTPATRPADASRDNQVGAGTGTGQASGTATNIRVEAVSALRRPIDAARAQLARLADSGEGLTPSVRHHLAHVTAELAEAARLVDDLLDAATGLSGLRKRPAELGRIVHAAVDAATDLAAAAGIDLAVHTGPAELVSDAERLTQAVRHLLVDTVQASPPGSTVVVAAARRGSLARIEIRGTEIGDVPEHLAFARIVVERHDGTVSVHRVDGKGVTYVIELPAGVVQESERTTSAGAGALARNLADETRIIPMVREIGPVPDISSPPRRSDPLGAPIGAAIQRQVAPSESVPSLFSSQENTSFEVPPTWFDNATSYAPSSERPSAARAELDDSSLHLSGGVGVPRGRRRAAAQQAAAQQAQAAAEQSAQSAYKPQTSENGYLVGGVSYQPIVAYPRPETRDSGLIQHVDGYRNDDSALYTPSQQSTGYAPELTPPAPIPMPTPAPIPTASPPRAWPNPDEPDYGPDFGWPQQQPPAAAASLPTLLVWPAPEQTSAELLIAQGYAPAALKTPSQLAENGPQRPVALLADPVGVPVTRAALHTLRAAAADSGIPLFVTAGLGAVPAATIAATARRGADPSALLRALTPEQVSAPRVLLVEEDPDLAAAFAISLERDGMRVLQTSSEGDAVTALAAEQPQLVVMNMTLIRRRRSGVVDWLRAYERLHLAPTVLYTVPASLAIDPEVLRALRSGSAAVHLTDREISQESANRLLDLMGKVAD